jgi:FkbM family methyltransferase
MSARSVLNSFLKHVGFRVANVQRVRDFKQRLAEAERARSESDRTYGETVQATMRSTLQAMEPAAFLRVILNREEMWLPRDTLRTMVHCLHLDASGRLLLFVETSHLDWMMDRLAPGGCLVDVGAATGAIALPIARRFGSTVRIIAFEPARAALGLLTATLARNGIDWLEVRQRAVSDATGTAPFLEFPQDETGTTPFLPEVSALQVGESTDPRQERYDVSVTTLDQEFDNDLPSAPVVVKIDVEGFETKVLAGASEFLARVRPALAIDIHRDPFGEGTTEPAVRALLEPAGYDCAMMGHVLVCSP